MRTVPLTNHRKSKSISQLRDSLVLRWSQYTLFQKHMQAGHYQLAHCTPYIHTYIHTHIHTHSYIYTRTYVCICIYMYMYMYLYVYVHVYIKYNSFWKKLKYNSQRKVNVLYWCVCVYVRTCVCIIPDIGINKKIFHNFKFHVLQPSSE